MIKMNIQSGCTQSTFQTPKFGIFQLMKNIQCHSQNSTNIFHLKVVSYKSIIKTWKTSKKTRSKRAGYQWRDRSIITIHVVKTVFLCFHRFLTEMSFKNTQVTSALLTSKIFTVKNYCLIVFSRKLCINIKFNTDSTQHPANVHKLAVNHKERRGNSNSALPIG